MYARLELIGNLTADPIVKDVSVRGEQRQVTEFSVAVNDPFNKEKPASFFNNLAAWNGVGKSIAQYAKKGERIFVVCDVEMNTVEKDGQKRTYPNYTVRDARFINGRREESSSSSYDQTAPPSETEASQTATVAAPAAAPVAETPAPSEPAQAELPAVPF